MKDSTYAEANGLRPWTYERPPFGVFGKMSFVGSDRVVCHVCGRDFRHLGPHIWRMHGLLAAEYRLRYRLGSRIALCGSGTSKKYSATNAKYGSSSHLKIRQVGGDSTVRDDALRASRISAERRRSGLIPVVNGRRYPGLVSAVRLLMAADQRGDVLRPHLDRIAEIVGG